jgi:hypothetical protein
MELIINAFLITVGVGLGCLALVFLVCLVQLAVVVFLERTEPRNRR